MSDKKVKIADKDTDIILVLPDKREITVQYRVEGPSVDILLPEIMPVYNWAGVEMKAAKAFKKSQQEVRLADQLCIPF